MASTNIYKVATRFHIGYHQTTFSDHRPLELYIHHPEATSPQQK